jgi:pyruvate dehydrogenase E2 component (dihydrolipoamide acetyltransferase)
MKYIFNFPDIGEGLDEGRIAEWHVKKGQQVKSGTILVSMETDKVVAEIPSPKTGVISALYGKPGDVIRVGEALVEIEIEGVSGQEAIIEAKLEPVKEEGAGVVGTLEIASSSAVMKASSEGMEESLTDSEKPSKKALATPVARAMAKDLGVDIHVVTGTGPAGRVMKEDIMNYAQKKTPQKTTVIKEVSLEDRIEAVPLTQIRKTIAKNMLQSKHQTAHMSVFDEVEITELERVRVKYKQDFSDDGLKLTYLAFVIKSTASALKKHKALNSEMDDANNQMLYKKYYNIGIAVDTEKGLMVPVVRDADKKSIRQIAAEIQDLSDRAREGKLSLDEMKDGTFTITSFGSIGGKFAVPVINYPQAGILGVGKVSKQAVVKNDILAVGLVMPLSVSVDHRIVDGGETTRFLNTVMNYLSDPVSMLMSK